MAIDFTVVQMGAIVFSINTGEVLLNYGIERIFCTIMSKTILLIVVYLMHKYNRNKTQISGRHLGICGLIACILVALDYYIAENSMMAVNDKMRMFLGIYFISSIVIILLVFSLVLKLGENYHQKNEISLLELQNEMMIRTSTVNAPWVIVEGNDKLYARIKVLETVVDALEKRLHHNE